MTKLEEKLLAQIRARLAELAALIEAAEDALR